MKVIADTHIFYYFGSDSNLFELVKDEPIVPNLLNILELSTTQNLIDKEEYVRNAIAKLYHYQDSVILEPPFLYAAQLFCEVPFDPFKEYGTFLELIAAIANGAGVDKKRIEEFRDWSVDIRKNTVIAADFANDKLAEIRENITDKKEHRKKDSMQLTLSLINNLVETVSKGICCLEERNLEGLELLARTLDHYFKELELTKMKMPANDLIDFSMMAYVQPGDKFWTTEKRWVRMITEAGLKHYLYEPKN